MNICTRAISTSLIHVGLGRYPDIVDAYVTLQQKLIGLHSAAHAISLYFLRLPVARGVRQGTSLTCFYAVSRVFSVGVLLVAAGFVRRLLPERRMAWAVLALMAFSPLQIHFAQHALVDGFFEFWALLTLWALWENLQEPGRPGWLAVYAVSLAAMVTTKENAFFVFVAVVGLLVANRWLRFGTVTRPLLVLTAVGPADRCGGAHQPGRRHRHFDRGVPLGGGEEHAPRLRDCHRRRPLVPLPERFYAGQSHPWC